MGPVLLAIAAALAGGLSLWGYGSAARRLTAGAPLSTPLTVALGLGAVLFIGGVLNLFRLATPLAMNATAGAGLLLAAAAGIRRLNAARPWPRMRPGDLPAVLLLSAAAIFFAARLAPAGSFNLHDDFEKYFAYPVRMLATGTLGGNPLSALGGETLGGQAWLQGFVLAHRPPEFIGAVDDFFGLILCLFIAGFALPSPRKAGVALAAQVAVLAINPQIVNVSSVYTGAALIMAACLLPAESQAGRPSSARLGLLYAGLLALKTTFLAFVGLHFAALALGRLRGKEPAGGRLRPVLAVPAWTGAFLAPWILLSAPLYRVALALRPDRMPPAGREPFRFLSTAPELYGATQLHYTALAALALVAAALAIWAGRRDPGGPKGAEDGAVAALFAAGGVYFAILGLMITTFGRELATRYASPVLIGAVPAALLLWPALRRAMPRIPIWPIALVGAAAAAFLPSLAARLRQIAAFRSPLAFNYLVRDPAFIEYNRSVLHGEARQHLAKIQALVPPGATIVAWVAAPFLLDYRRNPILETNEAGLGARWAGRPPPGYFLWQYQGYAVKFPISLLHSAKDFVSLFNGANGIDRINIMRAMQFSLYLDQQAGSGRILYNDGEIALFLSSR